MTKYIVWWFVAVFGFGVALTPGITLFLLNEPSPVSSSKLDVLTPEVAPGQDFKMHVSSEITKKCKGTIWRSIIDSAGVQTNYKPVPRPDDPDFSVSLTVPLGAAPGPATYQSRIEWECNYVQELWPRVVLLRRALFTITPLAKQVPDLTKQGAYTFPSEPTAVAQGIIQ